MPRPPTYHQIPATQRICINLDAPDIRTLRKLAIDLGMPERDIVRLAVRVLLARYEAAPPGAVASRGVAYFSEKKEV